MLEHKYRVIAIAIAFVVVLGTLVAFHLTDTGQGLRERLEGMLALLVPALLDALAERRKRATIAPPPPDGG